MRAIFVFCQIYYITQRASVTHSLLSSSHLSPSWFLSVIHTNDRFSKRLPSRCFLQKQFLFKQQEQLLNFLWFYLDCVQSNNKRFLLPLILSSLLFHHRPRSISNKMPLFKRMMECECVSFVNDVRTSRTHTHINTWKRKIYENLEKSNAATKHKPAKIKKIDSLFEKKKKYVKDRKTIRLSLVLFIGFVRFCEEWECFCCRHSSSWSSLLSLTLVVFMLLVQQ